MAVAVLEPGGVVSPSPTETSRRVFSPAAGFAVVALIHLAAATVYKELVGRAMKRGSSTPAHRPPSRYLLLIPARVSGSTDTGPQAMLM